MIFQEIFVGLRKCIDFNAILDDKDLEYLEAACFLHNIGIITGKKGYHKQSYHIIKVSSSNSVKKYSSLNTALYKAEKANHRSL